MGNGPSKDNCDDCAFFEHHVDTICDLVYRRTNPQCDEACQAQQCNDLKALVRDLVKASKMRDTIVAKHKMAFAGAMQASDFKRMQRIVTQLLSEEDAAKTHQDKLSKALKALDIQDEIVQTFADVMVQSDKSIAEKRKALQPETWTETVVNTAKWVMEQVSWLFDIIWGYAKQLMDKCFEHPKKCIVVVALVVILVYAYLCQSRYDVTSPNFDAEAYLLENNWSGATRADGGVYLPFGIATGAAHDRLRARTTVVSTTYGVNEVRRNDEHYLWSVAYMACPYVRNLQRYLQGNEYWRALWDGIQQAMRLGKDVAALATGSNKLPLLPYYSDDLRMVHNTYNGLSVLGNCFQAYQTASPMFAIPGIGASAGSVAVTSQFLYETTWGNDVRNYNFAVSERMVLRPLLMQAVEYGGRKLIRKYEGGEKWDKALNGALVILEAVNTMYSVYHGLEMSAKGMVNPSVQFSALAAKVTRLKREAGEKQHNLDDKIDDKIDHVANELKKSMAAFQKDVDENLSAFQQKADENHAQTKAALLHMTGEMQQLTANIAAHANITAIEHYRDNGVLESNSSGEWKPLSDYELEMQWKRKQFHANEYYYAYEKAREHGKLPPDTRRPTYPDKRVYNKGVAAKELKDELVTAFGQASPAYVAQLYRLKF